MWTKRKYCRAFTANFISFMKHTLSRTKQLYPLYTLYLWVGFWRPGDRRGLQKVLSRVFISWILIDWVGIQGFVRRIGITRELPVVLLFIPTWLFAPGRDEKLNQVNWRFSKRMTDDTINSTTAISWLRIPSPLTSLHSSHAARAAADVIPNLDSLSSCDRAIISGYFYLTWTQYLPGLGDHSSTRLISRSSKKRSLPAAVNRNELNKGSGG